MYRVTCLLVICNTVEQGWPGPLFLITILMRITETQVDVNESAAKTESQTGHPSSYTTDIHVANSTLHVAVHPDSM